MAAFMTVSRAIKLLEQHRGKLIASTPADRIEVFDIDGTPAGRLDVAQEEFVEAPYFDRQKGRPGMGDKAEDADG